MQWLAVANSIWCVRFLWFSYGIVKELLMYFPILLNPTGSHKDSISISALLLFLHFSYPLFQRGTKRHFAHYRSLWHCQRRAQQRGVQQSIYNTLTKVLVGPNVFIHLEEPMKKTQRSVVFTQRSALPAMVLLLEARPPRGLLPPPSPRPATAVVAKPACHPRPE